jgi:hypothetical protein
MRNRRKLARLVADAKTDVMHSAAEVAARLYNAIGSLPEMKLLDGSTAKVEKFSPPEVNDDGQWQCGIDVRLASGDLLEFTLTNTGWEKSFVGNLKAEDNRRPRGR